MINQNVSKTCIPFSKQKKSKLEIAINERVFLTFFKNGNTNQIFAIFKIWKKWYIP